MVFARENLKNQVAAGLYVHSPNHADCPACNQLRAMSVLAAELPFDVASEIWLNTHSQYIQASSLRVYEHKRKKLAEFFQKIPLGEIHIGNIRSYQQWRMTQVCPEMVNGEIGTVLAPMLAEIDRWQYFVRVYKRLREPKKRVRQSMTEEQHRRLLTIALDASRPRRLLAGHCLIVMCNTGTGFGELKHLKRLDVFVNEQIPHILVHEGTKNDYRIRAITLNWEALRSMKWILHRWEKLGGSDPNSYILPHFARRAPEDRGKHKKCEPIFDEPMLTIWNAARKILDEAGLNSMDPYDMRSHFATGIMSDPDVSESLAGEWIGHSKVAREMNRRYFAPHMKKMVKAVDKLTVDPAPTLKLIAFPGGRK